MAVDTLYGRFPVTHGFSCASRKCLKVKLEKVNILDVEILAALEFLFQKFDTLLVDLDSSELHGAVEQVFRQRAVPRANFQHGLTRLRRQITRDHLRCRNIQEILTKLTATCSIHTVKDRKPYATPIRACG